MVVQRTLKLVKAIENDDYDQLLNKFDIKKGDFFYIPSGTLHAICSGSLIYEAQQSSDITYRVYDYHRKDKDGNETVIDRDSQPNNVNKDNYGTTSQEDDDDFEDLIMFGKYFDLALRQDMLTVNSLKWIVIS